MVWKKIRKDNKMKMSSWSVLLISIPSALTACSGEARDALPFESRSAYVEDAANEACDRIDECGEIGTDKAYNTDDDCVVAKTDDFNGLWPSDKCEGERMNGEKFDDCMSRVSAVACDGFASFADNVAFAAECNADKLCTDAP